MISFNPPLNETTILNVPFHPGHLTFTATATSGQLDAHSIIQIWADIPDNSQLSINRGQQGWTPRSFQFHNNSSVASLSIPFRDFVHHPRSQFSFTYRILHPDGKIQWLGRFGKNGSLIVNRYDDRLVLFGDWSSDPHRHSFNPKSAIKSPLQVFGLSDKVQWRCWDLSNGSPRLLSFNDGPAHIHSALFVPSQPRAAIIPLSPIFLTSQDIQVTIQPNARSVYITSPSRGGLLSLQTLPPDTLISSLTAALPSLISIPNPDNHHAILLANPDRAPARLFAIPLSADSSASAPFALSVPLSPILPHLHFLSESSSRFSISKPTRFVSTSAQNIQLTLLDFGGAHFSLSPVYHLVKPDGDLSFSILAKHNRIPTPTGHNLLTPPPSPPMNATETEAQANHQSQVPVDDQPSQPIEHPLTSGQSTPNSALPEQLASGQSTPKPRTPVGTDSKDPTPIINRPVQRGLVRKLVYFVLRIILFYARILSKIALTIFARLFLFAIHVPRNEPVTTPKIRSVELDQVQQEVKATPVSSALHTPSTLTPRHQYSGASTPRNHPVNSAAQKVPGVAETLEAVASKIVPEFSAKAGEEDKSLGGSRTSFVQEDIENEKSGRDRDGEWEVVHRPGILFELTPLPSPPAPVEGEASPKIKPLKLTLGGEGNVVKGVKFHLDDVQLTDVKFEPLTGTGQEGLWTVEIPRASRELMTLRIS